MATWTPQGAGELSLYELANRTHKGNLMEIAEVLTVKNEFLQDAVWLEANETGGHTILRRTSVPAGSWTKINRGVAAESSTTQQITESIGHLESLSQIDIRLANKASDPAAFRAREDRAFIAGLGNTFASTFIYGDVRAYPERFKGLDPRVTSKTADNARDGGGSGDDTTSIWVIEWGPDGVFFTYPKDGASKIIQMDDLGVELVLDPTDSTKRFRAYMTAFSLQAGLVVKDDSAVQRICNIETTGSSNTFNDDDLIWATSRLPGEGQAVIYVNRTIAIQMHILAKDRNNVSFQIAEFGGRRITLFNGIPVRRVDSILETETALS